MTPPEARLVRAMPADFFPTGIAAVLDRVDNIVLYRADLWPTLTDAQQRRIILIDRPVLYDEQVTR